MLKNAFFYLIMFGLIAVVVEALVLLVNFSKYPDDLYDNRQEIIDKLNQNDLSNFTANRGDPVIGWNLYGPKVLAMKNCVGVEVKATYNAAGARTYPGYDEDSASIITVGDSFTHSSEAGDEDAYPARLAELLGASVANHGVGGFGPVQSFLNLKQKIHHYPNAKTIVLGIMYENIYRMKNSYRPALSHDSPEVYGLKPYIADGVIRPHPGRQVLGDIESFREYAKHAFDNDFWARPESRFPYSLSLLRSLKSNYFYYVQLQKIWRNVGIPEYSLAFRSEDILLELFSLLNQYVVFAQQKNLKPAVVFIPRNGYDTHSAAKMINANRNRFPQGLLIGDVGDAAVDWDKFNLVSVENGNPCHPSAYGYQRIADYVADLLGTGAQSH